MTQMTFGTLARRLAPLALAFSLPAVCNAASPMAQSLQDPTYADLADLADSANLVIIAQVRKLLPVEPARARGVLPGTGRYFVSARTVALLAGSAPIGEELRYLVDLPLDARGKPPRLAKREVVLFARTVPGRPGELQLVAPHAQIARTPGAEGSIRAILGELAAPGAPARVTGVREAVHVAGTLLGEGETQIFLATASGSAASITVTHRPDQPPAWGVSFSELVGETGNPPARDTLAWYRLACFLPDALPRGTNLSETPAARARAEADYRMLLGELGACPRTLR